MKDLSSELNRRITIEQPVEISDAQGGYNLTWQNFISLWAKMEIYSSRSSSERLAERQLQDVYTYKFLTRYYPGITTKMRIVFGNRSFNIKSVSNPDVGITKLEIIAQEGASI